MPGTAFLHPRALPLSGRRSAASSGRVYLEIGAGRAAGRVARGRRKGLHDAPAGKGTHSLHALLAGARCALWAPACRGTHPAVSPSSRCAGARPLLSRRCTARPVAAPGASGNGAAPSNGTAALEGAVPAKAAPAPKNTDKVDHVAWVMGEIARGDKVVICQTAPAVRVALGEEFDMPAGVATTGKMVAALRKLGFNYVFGG